MTTERRNYLIWLAGVVVVTMAVKTLIDLYRSA
jgi:hypothetical protein